MTDYDLWHSLRTKTAAYTGPLYHFTSTMHYPVIKEMGYLKLTESNVDITGAGPGVVWVTSDPNPVTSEGWAMGDFKTHVRFTVTAPDAHHWKEWAIAHGSDPAWMDALASVGGSDSWYVVEHTIPASDWTQVQINGIVTQGAKMSANDFGTQHEWNDGHEHEYVKSEFGVKWCKHCHMVPEAKPPSDAQISEQERRQNRQVAPRAPKEWDGRTTEDKLIDAENRRRRYRSTGK